MTSPVNFIDIIGMVFNKYTVIARAGARLTKDGKTKDARWLVRCECGNTRTVTSYSLRKGYIQSCGKCPDSYRSQMVRKRCYKGNSCFSGQRIGNIILNAKRRSITCESKKVLSNLIEEEFQKQDGMCYLCGCKVTPMNKYKCKSSRNLGASLDRLDSNIGYHKGNIKIACAMCNLIKRSLSLDEFKAIISKIDSNLQEQAVLSDVKPIAEAYFNNLKKKCLRASKTIELLVSKDDIWNIYEQQNYLCRLSGVPVYFGTRSNKQTASVDRIDSNGNYSVDNIQIVHKVVNQMRWDYPIDLFLDKVSQINANLGDV